MGIHELSSYFNQYGVIVIFVIVLLEYLNLPGFPAGVIMPLAGVWAASGNINFGLVLFLSVLAGLCGSWILYLLGKLGGEIFLTKYVKRFPKQKPIIDQTINRIKDKGYLGVFICKLIPVIRTVISIPAGVLKMDFIGYTFFSMLGITLWNLIFIGLGYFLGEPVINVLS